MNKNMNMREKKLAWVYKDEHIINVVVPTRTCIYIYIYELFLVTVRNLGIYSIGFQWLNVCVCECVCECPMCCPCRFIHTVRVREGENASCACPYATLHVHSECVVQKNIPFGSQNPAPSAAYHPSCLGPPQQKNAISAALPHFDHLESEATQK